MTRFHQYLAFGFGLVLGALPVGASEPSYEEVRGLIATNLPGITASNLDQAALHGVLEQFHGRVLLVTNTAPPPVEAAKLLSRTKTYESHFGYLRVSRVAAGLAEAVTSACQKLGSAPTIKGWIIDLRFAEGTDYQAATAVADLFISERQPLLEWKGETVYATAKTNALSGPAIMLVNQGTQGAAEALAEMLRQAHLGLLLGKSTAGQAAEFKDFKLQNGQTLRIATETLKNGAGQVFGPAGVQPDIEIQVGLEDERKYFADEYYTEAKPELAAGNTNRVVRPRVTEAELVRMKREGRDLDAPFAAEPPAAKPPTADLKPIRDPVLARGLDLLKGLAVLQSSPKKR